LLLKLHSQLRVRSAANASLLLCLATLAAQAPSRESDEQFARGVHFQQAGDLAAARSAYEAALKLSPRRIDALSNLGLVYGGLRQYDRAVKTLERAPSIVDPSSLRCCFNLGTAYLKPDKTENARRTLTLLAGARQ
jgi:Flp pilus assembly protein TadD